MRRLGTCSHCGGPTEYWETDMYVPGMICIDCVRRIYFRSGVGRPKAWFQPVER